MSLDARSWAWKQKITPHKKIVLMVLADCHNPETGQCNPSYGFIIEQTCVNKDTVGKVMKSLMADNLIDQYKPVFGRGNHYTLNLSVYITAKIDGRSANQPKVQVLANAGLPTPESSGPLTPESSGVLTTESSGVTAYRTVNRTVSRTVSANQEPAPSESPDRKIQKTTKNEVDFELFWEMWPKKTGKKAAEKAWLKIKDQSATLALIATNLEMQANSGNWTNPQYIPNPATYLNGENWNDTVYQRQEAKPRNGGVADTLSIDF
jgi:hypothetical protein